MSFINALYMLLGAGLVAFGVLVHAAAALMHKNHHAAKTSGDTWEGEWEWQPVSRVSSSRPALYRKASENKMSRLPADAADTAPDRPSNYRQQQIPTIPRKPQRDKRPTGEVDITAAMAKEVTLALVANGYDKQTAQAAVAQVGKSHRESLETWLVAALAACNPGRRGIA